MPANDGRNDLRCPRCDKALVYDRWEDNWICHSMTAPDCMWVYFPSDLGLERNPDSGIWHLGEKATQAE